MVIPQEGELDEGLLCTSEDSNVIEQLNEVLLLWRTMVEPTMSN